MPLTAADLVAQAKQQVTEIATKDLALRLDEQPIVIDVREPGEYACGCIPGCSHIPRGVLESEITNHPAFLAPDTPIYLYCRSGARSALAALTLMEMGFTSVYSVARGFLAWESENRSVSTGD